MNEHLADKHTEMDHQHGEHEDHSKATMRKMHQNLVGATAYNAIAIPAAVGIFQPFGFVLEPQWGALIVAINALLLRRARL
jgi:Cu2+-exporting ATPase